MNEAPKTSSKLSFDLADDDIPAEFAVDLDELTGLDKLGSGLSTD